MLSTDDFLRTPETTQPYPVRFRSIASFRREPIHSSLPLTIALLVMLVSAVRRTAVLASTIVRSPRVPLLLVLQRILSFTTSDSTRDGTQEAVASLVSKERAARASSHCAHEATLALDWSLRIGRVTIIPVRVACITRWRSSLTPRSTLAVVLTLLAVLLTVLLTLRLCLAVVEAAVLRWRISSRLLILILAILWCRRRAVSLMLLWVLLSVPTALALLRIGALLLTISALLLIVPALLIVALLAVALLAVVVVVAGHIGYVDRYERDSVTR